MGYLDSRLFVLNHAQMRICPELAEEIGFNEHVVFLQLEYLIATEGEWVVGRKWIRMSVRRLQKEFSFWGKSTVHRAIQSLVEQGLLDEDNFNGLKRDPTRWFAINLPVVKKTLKSVAVKDYEHPDPGRETSAENGRETGGVGTALSQRGTGDAPNLGQPPSQKLSQIEAPPYRALRDRSGEREISDHTPTPPPAAGHGLGQVGVGSKHDLKTCIAYATWKAAQPGSTIRDPEAVGRARHRDGLDDELIDEWLGRTPEAVAAERAAPADTRMTYFEACQTVHSMSSVHSREPISVVEELRAHDMLAEGVHQQLVEKFTPKAEAKAS